MAENNIISEINPLFSTSLITAKSLASFGDETAKALLTEVESDDVKEKFDSTEDSKLFYKSIAAATEVRYKTVENFFYQSGLNVFVDLPCGFTPRPFSIVLNNFRYYGIDLPDVSEKIKGIFNKYANTDCKNSASFFGVDATNKKALKEAFYKEKQKLFISTEGFLQYLTEPEFQSVCMNISSLLSEHGGYWVTTDFDSNTINTKALLSIFNNDVGKLKKVLSTQNSNIMNDLAKKNDFVKLKPNFLAMKLRDFGLNSSIMPISQFIKEIKALDDMPAVKQTFIQQLKNCNFWIMTATNDNHIIQRHVVEKDFEVNAKVISNRLLISIQGRLDTVTTPKLLEEFNSFDKSEYHSIIIDARDLVYTSSAGLRAFLIMYKSLKNKVNFQINNCSKEVIEIFKVTGFYELLFKF